MEREELLALRRQAREQKRQIDERRLEVHRQILDLLFRGDEGSEQIRAEALSQIELWEQNNLCIPRYSQAWREWLDLPEQFARKAILRVDDLGISMRQNSPFSHAMARIAGIAAVPTEEGEQRDPYRDRG